MITSARELQHKEFNNAEVRDDEGALLYTPGIPLAVCLFKALQAQYSHSLCLVDLPGVIRCCCLVMRVQEFMGASNLASYFGVKTIDAMHMPLPLSIVLLGFQVRTNGVYVDSFSNMQDIEVWACPVAACAIILHDASAWASWHRLWC